MIEVTAMISADPVDITAINIKSTMMISPVSPINLWATKGATRPGQNQTKGCLKAFKVYM